MKGYGNAKDETSEDYTDKFPHHFPCFPLSTILDPKS